MCGISGVVGITGGATARRMLAMNDALQHRGPDAGGIAYFSPAGQRLTTDESAVVALAHRRLSILDLSAAGAQPMANESGTVWITYNGEFYNHQDYRRELQDLGHHFQSRTDTETIVHLYEQYGVEGALQRMNGMFAFGLWDAKAQTLFLARDRVGKKPLYYAEIRDGLVFASELKALYASGLIDLNRLDEQALGEAIMIGTPLGERTMFEQVRVVPPGCYVRWSGGRLTLHRYYINPFERLDPEEVPEQARVDELEELLVDATRIRLVADVPVGLFLSGGVDSSLIAALAAKRLNAPVRAYCISFPDQQYNESEYARRVAQHLDLPLTVMPSLYHDVDVFEKIADHIDQPLGDASLIPTYLVSESARAAGVKVALTGDGGDELFAGYEEYRNGLKFWGTTAQRKLIRQNRTWRERLWEERVRMRGFARGYVTLQNQFGWRHRLRAYKSSRVALRDQRRVTRRRVAILNRLLHRPILDRMQFSDIQTLMVDVILRKIDLMSMAHGLECRSPLLDYRVLELAARLTFTDKYDATGRGKRLLRNVLARYVPRALFERPKMGFCIPWEKCCRGPFAADLKQRWRRLDMPHLRANAGDWLFDEPGVGGMFRMWSAFTHIVFFEKRNRLLAETVR